MSTDDRSLMWSGPGRALDAHLDLFRYVDGAVKFIHKWADNGKPAPMNWRSFPPTLTQRLGLMTTVANTKMELVVDGHSVGPVREDMRQWGSEYNVQRTAALLQLEYETLNEGETHYVSHHVASMLEAAAEGMADEPLFDTDIPSPTGLIVLEYPLILPDLHPDTGVVTDELMMPVRAIGWSTHTVHIRDKETGELLPRQGIAYTIYTDADAFSKFFVESTRRVLGWERAERYEVGDPVRMWAVDSTAWAFGMEWQSGNEATGDEGEGGKLFGAGLLHMNMAILRRWLLAYFRWTWQRILVPQSYRPRKHETKRAMRAGRPVVDGHIKVLRLRREVEAERRGDSEPSGFTASHQWIVRGHPRRQWYRSLGPARNDDGSFNIYSHRRIWIEPHLAGNPYGPLAAGHNVTAAVR